MSGEIVWYVGCPLVAAGLSLAAVRFTRAKNGSAPAARTAEDDEPPLLLATAAPQVTTATEARTARDDVDEHARSTSSASSVVGDDVTAAPIQEKKDGVVARLMRRGVGAVVRHRAPQPQDEERPDVLSAVHAEDAAPAAMVRLADAHDDGVNERHADDVAPVTPPGEDAPHKTLPDNVTQLFPLSSDTALGNGIIEFEPEPAEERAIVGADWAAEVSAREISLAATLEARDAAERLDRQRQDEAAALLHQQELERIAVAEEARVRAEARARRWFARLDADLDAPTVGERAAMAMTLAIPAPWAGKLLREAFAQEEEPKVRARIIGALVAGNHLDVTDPFETAFARGGIERAAVWESLKPRRSEAVWIAALLAPLVDAMAAA